jgi:hypothetical protein
MYWSLAKLIRRVQRILEWPKSKKRETTSGATKGDHKGKIKKRIPEQKSTKDRHAKSRTGTKDRNGKQ